MSLPEFSGAWPPEPWDIAQAQYDLHSAWLEGNTAALEGLYQLWPNGAPPTRPSQWRGGIVGMVARFWWGRPTLQAAQKRLHVPAAADVARTSADLLFGQAPQWVLSDGDATDREGAQDRLNQLLEGADVTATLLEAAELQSALGGVYLRLWWDTGATDKVCLGVVAPDAAIPEWRYGKLAAVTFWTVVQDDKRGVWRHLERHEPGSISHALYLGDRGNIGREMKLSESDATAWAADLVDENSSIATGVKGLTAAYVPNVRPSRRWRNIPHLAPLGRSDFEGIEPLFDQLDEAYSSWMRDLDLAKARLFVAAELLEDQGPGKGAIWDPEQAIFTPVPSDSMTLNDDNGTKLVQAQQFEIRHAEHQATCQALLNRILVGAGYSVGDFGDDQLAGAMTATEVSARKSLSAQTRAKKILYWQSAFQPLARTMLELDGLVYGGGDYGLKADPEMKFPVRVDQDPVQQSISIANMRTAEAMSIEAAVREYRPNWSSDEVDEEVGRIKDELAAKDTTVPALGDFTSNEPNTSGASATMEAHSDLQGGLNHPVKPTADGGMPKAA
jgi:A118 family predicted phage portal protein